MVYHTLLNTYRDCFQTIRYTLDQVSVWSFVLRRVYDLSLLLTLITSLTTDSNLFTPLITNIERPFVVANQSLLTVDLSPPSNMSSNMVLNIPALKLYVP